MILYINISAMDNNKILNLYNLFFFFLNNKLLLFSVISLKINHLFIYCVNMLLIDIKLFVYIF